MFWQEQSTSRQSQQRGEIKLNNMFCVEFLHFFSNSKKKISIFTCSSKDTSGVWKNIETFLHFFVEIKIEESCLKTTPKNTNLYNSSHAFPRQAFYCIGREYIFFMESFNCGKLRLHCEQSISLNLWNTLWFFFWNWLFCAVPGIFVTTIFPEVGRAREGEKLQKTLIIKMNHKTKTAPIFVLYL